MIKINSSTSGGHLKWRDSADRAQPFSILLAMLYDLLIQSEISAICEIWNLMFKISEWIYLPKEYHARHLQFSHLTYTTTLRQHIPRVQFCLLIFSIFPLLSALTFCLVDQEDSNHCVSLLQALTIVALQVMHLYP